MDKKGILEEQLHQIEEWEHTYIKAICGDKYEEEKDSDFEIDEWQLLQTDIEDTDLPIQSYFINAGRNKKDYPNSLTFVFSISSSFFF